MSNLHEEYPCGCEFLNGERTKVCVDHRNWNPNHNIAIPDIHAITNERDNYRACLDKIGEELYLVVMAIDELKAGAVGQIVYRLQQTQLDRDHSKKEGDEAQTEANALRVERDEWKATAMELRDCANAEKARAELEEARRIDTEKRYVYALEKCNEAQCDAVKEKARADAAEAALRQNPRLQRDDLAAAIQRATDAEARATNLVREVTWLRDWCGDAEARADAAERRAVELEEIVRALSHGVRYGIARGVISVFDWADQAKTKKWEDVLLAECNARKDAAPASPAPCPNCVEVARHQGHGRACLRHLPATTSPILSTTTSAMPDVSDASLATPNEQKQAPCLDTRCTICHPRTPASPATPSKSVAKRHAIMREEREERPATATKEECRHATLVNTNGGGCECAVCGHVIVGASPATATKCKALGTYGRQECHRPVDASGIYCAECRGVVPADNLDSHKDDDNA